MKTSSLGILIVALSAVLAAPLAVVAQPNQPGPLVPGVPNANNPYTPFAPNLNGVGPLNPYTNTVPGLTPPYYPGGFYESPFSGIANIIDAQNRYWTSTEMSRILREKAYREHLKGRKAAAELHMWLKKNTPSFTKLQLDAAAERLKRIQKLATPDEILSGNALNLLLKDMGEQPAGGPNDNGIPISEEVLQQLNVTAKNFKGSLGLLRDDGRFTWPAALEDITNEKDRRKIEVMAQDLVHQAQSNGKVSGKGLADLEKNMIKLRKELDANVLKIPVRQFWHADRFMRAFDRAIFALGNKTVAQNFFKYRQWIKGGKTVKELVIFLDGNGLEFGPSVMGDEAAYSAAYSAFARSDIVLNVARNKKGKE